MEIDQLRAKIKAGELDALRVFELLVKSQQQLVSTQQQLASTQRQLAQAVERIEEFEKRLGGPPAQKLDEPYSVQAELRRQEKKARQKRKRKQHKNQRRGRMTTAEKIKMAERTIPVFPADVEREKCRLSHTRVVWRLEDGRAVLVAYDVYRGPGNRYGQVPGVVGRCEFGIEIMLAIGWQVQVLGLSFDKVCLLMNFFQSLLLRKSQVDALLTRLARYWQEQFEILCTLVANSAVVHADETSWSINSVWAFLGEQARVILFGVHKDAETLHKMLDPTKFTGLLVSDDAGVYHGFTKSQKCWAHLLRKAIRLTLLEPENQEYRCFADELLAIYHKACQVQRDGRLSPAGRETKVGELDDRIVDLCMPKWQLESPKLEGPADDYRLLVNEVMKLMLDRQLFQFVTAEEVVEPSGESRPVSGTNNEAERTLRNPAMARKTGRTNKTPLGARRQTVIFSVLESLRCYLADYTLASVTAEVNNWLETGRTCFERLLRKLKLKMPAPPESDKRPLLERLIPSDTS